MSFDLIVKNGMIVDGSGLPRYRGDVGVKDGKIAEIGRLTGESAKETVDADGRVVAPGDREAQATRCVDNLLAALAERGASASDLLKTTIFVVAESREDLVAVWEVVEARLGRIPSTLLGVSLLGYPDQLVEIEAIAAIRAHA